VEKHSDMRETMVLELLRQSGALLEGHFRLSSGNHAAQYVQCARLLEDPRRAEQVCAFIAEKIRSTASTGSSLCSGGGASGVPGSASDVVVGPAIGGILVAYELARALGVCALFTERVDGEMTLRRGFSLCAGQRVWIAEDVVTTGKSLLEAADAVAAHGAVVVGIACIVDRRPAGVALPFPIVSALKMEIEIFPPETCPLCANGIPVVKPGSRPEVSG